MSSVRVVTVLGTAILLGACGQSRIAGPSCEPAVTVRSLAADRAPGLIVDDFENAVARAIDAWSADPANSESGEQGLLDEADTTFDYLALSAGGQWGAFGAGFLNGWSTQPEGADKRPIFEVVTGVSAGAIIAPLAFLGQRYDAVLKEAYDGVRDSDVFEKRPLITVPFSNSLYDTGPLRRRIETYVDDDFLNAIAEANGERLLAVGTVDLDSGEFGYFDLTKIAANKENTDRKECFVSAILASTAIPVAFPPVFLNDRMYVDGGARQHLFVAGVGNAIIALSQRSGASPLAIAPTATRFYFVVNGNMKVGTLRMENRLIPIAGRSLSAMLDQLLFHSLLKSVDIGQNVGGEIRIATGRGITCAREACIEPQWLGDQFDPCITQCLFENGKTMGAETPLKWMTNPDEVELHLRGLGDM